MKTEMTPQSIASLKDWFFKEENALHEFLETIVNINSFTSNVSGVNSVQSYLQGEFEKLGLETQRIETGGSGDVLLAKTLASVAGSSSILLVGHSDTAHPPDSSFKEFKREGDKATGPGVLDMKGGLVVLLGALRALKHMGVLSQLPITVFISPDEEAASCCSKDVLLEQSKAALAALVFEWGREGGNLITCRRGIGVWEVQVTGKSGHSGNAHRESVNAISELAHFVGEVHQLTDYKAGITANVGKIAGGTAINTVPDHAVASFEVRANSLSLYQLAAEKIKDLAARPLLPGAVVRVEEKLLMPPMEESGETAQLLESFKSAGSLIGLEYDRVPEILGGGSDANYAASVGTPTIDGLGPFGEFAHTDKEYILLSSLQPKTLNLAIWLQQQF